jgi:hypothetical protein
MRLFNFFKRKPAITLHQDSEGWYIVKVYDRWMPETLTKNLEKATESYNEYLEVDKTRKIHKQILPSTK